MAEHAVQYLGVSALSGVLEWSLTLKVFCIDYFVQAIRGVCPAHR